MVDETFKANALPKEFANAIGKIIRVQWRLVDAEMDPSFNPVLFDDLRAGKKAESKLTIVQRLKNGHVRCLVQGKMPDLKSEIVVQNDSEKFSCVNEEGIKEVIAGIGTSAEGRYEILETGIKIIDLLCPFPKRGNIGLMGSTGTGRSALVAEMYRKFPKEDGELSIFFFVGPDEASSVSAMIEHEPDLRVDEGDALQTTWLITANAAESGFAKNADYLDARPFFSAELAAQKRFPAIDPIQSHSRLLKSEIVGEEHFEIASRVRELLTNERNLDDLRASRARKIRNYFTQPFFVMASISKVEGRFASISETVRTCKMILAGDLDDVPERAFMYTGGEVNATMPN